MNNETKKPKIFIIEDEPMLLKAITAEMDIHGLETKACISGEEALECMRGAHEKAEYPDAIWLDYYLKDFDGLTFMAKLKEIEGMPDIPVIVVSNSAEPEKVKGMLALGVQKYYLKADNKLGDLIETLKDLINMEKKSRNGGF